MGQTNWSVAVLAIVLLVAAAVGVSALGWSVVAAQDSSVSVGDNFYDPSGITVQTGSTITWTNVGQTAHTITSDDGSFDSGLSFEPGRGYSVFFEFPGVYGYHCQIHGTSMSGAVNVQAPETPTPAPTPRTAPPTITPPPAPDPTPAPVVTSPATTPTPRLVTATPSARPTSTPTTESVDDEQRDTLAVLGLIALAFLAGLGVMAFRRGRIS